MEEEKDRVENKGNIRVDKHYHQNKAIAIILAVMAVVVIAGGAAAVGFKLLRHMPDRGINKISIERGGEFGMMDGGREGRGMMYGGRTEHRQRGGIEGKITKVDGDNITINNGSSDIRVAILDSTSIYDSTGGIISKSDLKVDGQIIVRGRPNSDGIVQAVIIQVRQ